jgi:hypothetical protein
MAIFMLLAYGLLAVLGPPRDAVVGLPGWLGRNWTPHGAFLARLPAAWGMLFAWMLLLGCCYAGGNIAGVDALSGVAEALVFFLFIQAIMALKWAHDHGADRPVAPPEEPVYQLYRIASEDPAVMTQALLALPGRSDQQETPLSGIRQIARRSLPFVEDIKGVVVQPVVVDFFSIYDKEVENLQARCADQTEKAVVAVDQRLAMSEVVEGLETQIAQMRESHDTLLQENQSLRTNSRMSGGRDYSRMSLVELEGCRQKLFNDVRVINDAIQTRKPGAKNKIAGTS